MNCIVQANRDDARVSLISNFWDIVVNLHKRGDLLVSMSVRVHKVGQYQHLHGVPFNHIAWINGNFHVRPNATGHTAHHMLIYGCEEPGSADDLAWSCGEMHSELDGGVAHRPPCASKSQGCNSIDI